MTKPSSEEKIQEWQENIHKQKQSGLSIAVWCRQNNTFPHIFSYWKKRLTKPDLSRASFVEVTNAKTTGLFFECQGIRLYVNSIPDKITLKQCLVTLKELAC